ncbi:MAG: N-glycosylase/DNA lyase [Candidatus Gracilibacteria bacterium]
MQKLYNLLKNYTLEDALILEKQDLQYKALEKLFEKISDKKLFFGLILTNSLVCYQLSSTGEKYWEEFSKSANDYFLDLKFKQCIKDPETNSVLNLFQYSGWQSSKIITFLKQFLPNSKGNKRLLEVKIKRLEKVENFINIFLNKLDYYLENLVILRDELAKTMSQKKDAKTIVFAIKMIMYGISIDKRGKNKDKSKGQSIKDISIPIDSRLTKIFEVYKEDYTDIKLFYYDLSEKLEIPEIHLDAILWVNYNNLIQK